MGKLIDSLFGTTPKTPLTPKKTWILVAKTYAPPIKVVNYKITNDDTLEKVLFGVTTCIWQCRETGEIRREEILGSTQDRYDELLRKVDVSGGAIQYVTENGKTYAITEWVKPPENKANEPETVD